MPYGAFVDIGGIEGLLHLNNLSWEKVESVEDMLIRRTRSSSLCTWYR